MIVFTSEKYICVSEVWYRDSLWGYTIRICMRYVENDITSSVQVLLVWFIAHVNSFCFSSVFMKLTNIKRIDLDTHLKHHSRSGLSMLIFWCHIQKCFAMSGASPMSDNKEYIASSYCCCFCNRWGNETQTATGRVERHFTLLRSSRVTVINRWLI